MVKEVGIIRGLEGWAVQFFLRDGSISQDDAKNSFGEAFEVLKGWLQG